MEDFINMDPDAALNAPTYKYIPQANLFKMSQQILSEQEPPLKMEFDSMSEDGNWIITQQNGEPVVGPALQILRKRLSADPRVLQAYQTKSYVAGRDFAAAGMKAGEFSSVQEGQNAWAQKTISNIEANNKEKLEKGAIVLNEQRATNVRWENYKKENGVIPDSDDDKLMKEQLSAYEATKLAMENQIEVRDTIATPTKDLETTLNRAYQLLMMTNMDSDMIQAAQSYSMRDMKSTIKVNPYAKQDRQFKMDMAKMRAQDINRRNLAFDLQAQKKIDDIDLAKMKGELSGSVLFDKLNRPQVIIGKSGTNQWAVDEDGKMTSDTDVQQMSFDQYVERNNTLKNIKVEAILTSLRLQNPAGTKVDGKNTNTWTVNTGDGAFTGSLSQIRMKLNEKVEGQNDYTHAESIDQLFNKQSKLITARDPASGTLLLKGSNPGLVENLEFIDLVNGMEDIEINQDVTDKSYQATLKIYEEASKITEAFVRKDKHINAMMNKGMPGIMKTLPSGMQTVMTQEEHYQAALEKVQNKTMTNHDQVWVNDTGTSNEDYMHWSDVPTGQSYTTRDGEGGNKTVYPTKRKWVVDTKALKDETAQTYNALFEKLNAGLTGNLTEGEEGVPTATFNSMLNGRKGSFENLESGVTYAGNFDPKSPEGPGAVIFGQYADQMHALNAKGIAPTIFTGELKGETSESEKIKLMQFMNEYVQEASSYLGNPKSSNSIPASPRGRWEYSGVFGDPEEGDKTMAAYRVTPPEAYIDAKLKGGIGDANYGGYKNMKEALMKGVTISFPQSEDINPRKESNNWGNPVVAKIMASPNGVHTTKVNNASGDGIGSYSFSQLSPSQYIMNYEYRTYQPGGSWTTSPMQSNVIPVRGSDFSALVKKEAFAKMRFAQRALESDLAKAKDVAVNGKK
jgi:hypothetical protein